MQNAYWVSMVSGLVGTIVGAAISWYVTRSSIKKQHENQLELVNEQERKIKKTAFRSVITEFEHNQACLQGIEAAFRELEVDYLDMKERDVITPLKYNKWEKHSDTIESLLTLEQLKKLVEFYIKLSLTIHTQKFNLERLSILQDDAKDCIKMLKKVEFQLLR